MQRSWIFLADINGIRPELMNTGEVETITLFSLDQKLLIGVPIAQISYAIWDD